MLFRARRVPDGRAVQAFDWVAAAAGPVTVPAFVTFAESPQTVMASVATADPIEALAGVAETGMVESDAERQARAAAIEREAFTQGYAAGERSGAEAGAQRAEALVRRLSATLDELANLRRTLAAEAEQDLVRLALAVARRVVQREVQLDADLVAALAHVALDRLDAGRGPATIKMHPDDIERLSVHTRANWEQAAIRLVPDASIARGGSLVETVHGRIDTGLDRQFAEIAHALLGDERAPASDVRSAA